MISDVHLKILQVLSCALFGGDKPELYDIEIKALVKEAKAQSVFPYIFSVLKNELKEALSAKEFEILNSEYLAGITNNIRVHIEHGELHRIMTKAGIPYVVLKGCASSSYYAEPDLRSMGDVDFLVYESDIEKGIKALENNGFKRDRYEFTTNQSAYHRPPMSIWEIHKSPSGLPKGEEGKPIKVALDDIIEHAVLYERDGETFRIPNEFHHGLILLLHKISHMTTTGIGLRHLCDWAVFESSFSNEDFKAVFEEKLKSFGLWKFAQIMTLVCEKYLSAPKREWAENSEINEEQLNDIIDDILTGGNFGKKDENRYREIKYLTDREKGKLGNKGIVFQALSSLNAKVYINHKFIDNHKFFLPFGWIVEGGKYLVLLISGKRKNKGTVAMLKEAAKRKDIYSKMELFKTE